MNFYIMNKSVIHEFACIVSVFYVALFMLLFSFFDLVLYLLYCVDGLLLEAPIIAAADNIFIYLFIFFFFIENKYLHFILIICQADNLHEIRQFI